MTRILFLGEGPDDAAVVPVFVSRCLGREIESVTRGWRDFRLHGKPGFGKKLKLAAFNAQTGGVNGMVATLDGDRQPAEKLKSLCQGREQLRQNHPELAVAVGVAIPELEAWLLDDPNAVKQALELDARTKVPEPSGRAQDTKERLNNLIGHSPIDRERTQSIVAIALKVSLRSSRKQGETGLRAFYDDVTTEFKCPVTDFGT